MTHKEVFKEPLVRFDMGRARFPSICPVCCRPAKKYVRLVIRPAKKQYLRAMWDPELHLRGRYRKIFTSHSKTLVIPVCEKHEFTSADFCRLRVLCIVTLGVTVGSGWFAFLKLGSDIAIGRNSELWVYGLLALMSIAIVLTVLALRPRPIEAAIKVVGFDQTLQSALVAFKNSEYREEFLQTNPTVAEPVKWIARA